MLYKGVATCYLNLSVISSCCFDTNSEITEMFLMIHLYQIAQLITNSHYIFKQLSESVAQIMSQKMFLKTPWISKLNRLIWTVERYSQPPVLKQNKSSTYSEPLTHNKNNFTQKCCSFKTAQALWKTLPLPINLMNVISLPYSSKITLLSQ